MSGSVDFSQMARSWALVPRPGAAAAARRHPATCRLLQPTPDPNTGGEVRAGWLAGWRAGQGSYPDKVRTHPPGAGGVRFACGGLVWLSGCLVRIPSFVSTASSYPHPPAVPQSVGKGSLPELRSHLLPSPRWFFSSRPPIQGAASTFHSSLLSSQSSPARRTQTCIWLTRLLLCSIVSLHTGSHSPSPFQ